MTGEPVDSFEILSQTDQGLHYYSLAKLTKLYPKVATLPRTLKILLENLVRNDRGDGVVKQVLVAWLATDRSAAAVKQSSATISNATSNTPPTSNTLRVALDFQPSRVLLQDFTGVPVLVDLAAIRQAVADRHLGSTSVGAGQPVTVHGEQVAVQGEQLAYQSEQAAAAIRRVNPLIPVDLVIDHSVMVDYFGDEHALAANITREFERNQERYQFLKWGSQAFKQVRVVPPGTGIVHQVNLEYLAPVVATVTIPGLGATLVPDTVVGTDSHTTMINGLGVLGWGVGGIEAEAAMLGQPLSLVLPEVVGVCLKGAMPVGTTATDLVLHLVALLRSAGVVDKFVEFFGPGLDAISLADRATIANMAPEYGATCGYFPVDAETLKYLELTGREPAHIAQVQQYAKLQGLYREVGALDADLQFDQVLHLDLATIEPSLAGPKRPQDRVALFNSKSNFQQHLSAQKPPAQWLKHVQYLDQAGHKHKLADGLLAIAAITSCTNTSNPSVMLAAGLLAQKAVALGLQTKPWVKTSLAPGSQVVTAYLQATGLLQPLEQLGFNIVGYGCTTCIGNSGPLEPQLTKLIQEQGLLSCAILSGNRNFEGRIHPLVKFAYLASPPLVVAYALAGTMDIDPYSEPLGISSLTGKPVFLQHIWPTEAEIQELLHQVTKTMFQERYQQVFVGESSWQQLATNTGELYNWQADSDYIKLPPYLQPEGIRPANQLITGARVLAWLGDSVTTDHISPAGNIASQSEAGKYLLSRGVPASEFNSYGSRRGNHEVMMRGTLANIRLRNLLVPDQEGSITKYWPTGELMSIYAAAMAYQQTATPLLLLAGKEYGTGSSRDWAAKGVSLLGVRFVLAESFERIHRSNLIGMGVVPLEFMPANSAASLGLDGSETYSLDGRQLAVSARLSLQVVRLDGSELSVPVLARIDTELELQYLQAGGVLPYVLQRFITNA